MTERAVERERRVALVGYGLAGELFHAPFIAATPGLRLAAIVTRDAERGARAARAHAGVEVLDDAARVWERARELDLVVIAAPNRAHVPLAMAALAAGLHVVVDKPIAPTAAQARALADEARRRGLALVPFHNRRWDGDFVTLRRLLREGALGEPLRFESRFDRWRPAPRGGWRESADPGEAGGLLYDLGSHLVDQALVLFGRVERVYAEFDRRRAGVAVEDDVFVALTHASGVRSHLSMGVVAAQPGPRFRLLGLTGAYVKAGVDPQEAALREGRRPDGERWGEEPEALWGRLGVGDEARPVRTEAGDYRGFYAGVVAALEWGAPLPVDVEDAIAGLSVLEAARASAADGRVVTPPSTIPAAS